MINPNETQALLAALYVKEGQKVPAGEILASLETTKAAADVSAPRDGYIVGLRFGEGDSIPFGEPLCYIAEQPGEAVPAGRPSRAEPEDAPAGLRITRPALELARRTGLDLGRLAGGGLVTESVVRAQIEALGQAGVALKMPAFTPQSLLIYGGGGHGKSLIELARAEGKYIPAGVVDDGMEPGLDVLGVPVLGGRGALEAAYQAGAQLAANATGGLSDIHTRKTIFDRLEAAGLECPALVHPTAFVEASAELAAGVQVFPHAYVGSSAKVEYGVIVNTGVILSHDVVIGAYSNISPGAVLAGGVQAGDFTLVGMGVTVNLEVKIGEGARIGNSAVIKADVPAGAVVRAGHVWPE